MSECTCNAEAKFPIGMETPSAATCNEPNRPTPCCNPKPLPQLGPIFVYFVPALVAFGHFWALLVTFDAHLSEFK